MNTNPTQQLPRSWARLKVASTSLATLLIPLVIAVASNEYTSAIKANEIGQRYVELAVGILSKPPENSTTHIREWAVKVVDHYSEVDISEGAQRELTDQQLKAIESLIETTKKIQTLVAPLAQ